MTDALTREELDELEAYYNSDQWAIIAKVSDVLRLIATAREAMDELLEHLALQHETDAVIKDTVVRAERAEAALAKTRADNERLREALKNLLNADDWLLEVAESKGVVADAGLGWMTWASIRKRARAALNPKETSDG